MEIRDHFKNGAKPATPFMQEILILYKYGQISSKHVAQHEC
jgi:hypothetical protein